jgi:hypothetical protein
VSDTDKIARVERILGRGADHGVRVQPTDQEARRLVGRPTAQGGRDTDEASGRERPLVTPDLRGFRRPDWLAELAHEGRPVSELLAAVADRVMERPDEEHLRIAEKVLNDVGRRPEGAAAVRAQLTQELVGRVLAGGG